MMNDVVFMVIFWNRGRRSGRGKAVLDRCLESVCLLLD